MQLASRQAVVSVFIFVAGLCMAKSCLADTIGIGGQLETFGDGSQAIQVTKVVPGSESDALGVKPGDYLLAVNGQLPRSQADFTRLLGSKNGFITLVIFRNGRQLALTGILNQNQGSPGVVPLLAAPKFKFPNPLDIEISQRSAGDGERRVRIDKVLAGGLGAKFGLARHDYIASVNGRPISLVSDLETECQRARGQIVLQLTDVLKRKTRTVIIRP
jgi:S1-C subfamily serine protease